MYILSRKGFLTVKSLPCGKKYILKEFWLLKVTLPKQMQGFVSADYLAIKSVHKFSFSVLRKLLYEKIVLIIFFPSMFFCARFLVIDSHVKNGELNCTKGITFTMAFNTTRNFLLITVKLLLIEYLTKVYTFSHDRLGIPQMDWWGDLCYIIVYKIFEKMYLVLGWTTNYIGKLSLVQLFEITWSKTAKTQYYDVTLLGRN